MDIETGNAARNTVIGLVACVLAWVFFISFIAYLFNGRV
jgi:hypothetical protein